MTSETANRQLCYFALIVLSCWLASGLSAHAQDHVTGPQLSLDQFLSQVKQGNTGTRGAAEASEGARMASQEGKTLLAPTAFANLNYTHDGKPQVVPITTYDFQNVSTYSIGLSQQTQYGLQAKLSTNLYSLSYDNPNSPFFAALAPILPASSSGTLGTIGASTYNLTTQLDITQSIWGNGFGRSTRANQEQLEAQALSQSYANRYAERGTLVDAEGSYWRLATARQTVGLTRDNLDRAQKTYEWNERRVRLQLADKSDALQSQALLESRKLEYQRAIDDERTSARNFNTARGVASDEVPETLVNLSPEMILSLQAPKRAEFRDDVKAAAEQSRATVASSTVAEERNKPTLDAVATLALNGQDTSLGHAYAQSVSMDHPTAAIGIRFSAPLDFGTLSETRAGYARQQAAADLTYQRKVFEQDQGWKDLADRLDQSKRRLQLAYALEKVQDSKLFHERERYKMGRTTAFQVLTFETDFAQSELQRILAQSDVLAVLTQMKLYGEAL